MTTREQAIEWWHNLTIKQQWDLFFKYNPIIEGISLNIGLDINNVFESHIEEIWQKEMRTQ